MTPKNARKPVGTSGSAPLAFLSAVVVVLLSVTAVVKLSGCAGRSPAEAENREVRLTHDEAVKLCPRYSPDGAWIAYAARSSSKTGNFAIYVIPPAGGEPRQVSPDSLSLYPLRWGPESRSMLCREVEGLGTYDVGLDGSVRLVGKGERLVRLLAVSPDGKTELVARFNKDNRDVGMRKAGGKIEFLAETPAWEEDATFGPGPEDVTVVSMPSYMAPVSTISVWSPTTHTYTPLPLPNGRKAYPAWSPDGSLLAYSSVDEGQSDIWLYDPSSTRATPLVEDPQDAICPAWSPDGEWIAFVRSAKTSHLFAGEPSSPDRRQLTDGPGRDYSATASPDGKWIAFLRRPQAGAGQPNSPQLCVMPAAGGEVKELDLKGVALPQAGEMMLAWSHDGREIAFNGSDGSAKMDIYRIGRDGDGLARVTVEPGEEVEPRWSPDGRYICYTQVGAGRLDVAIVPAHGGLPRVVSPEGMKSEGGVWSPSSDRVAHASYAADGRFEVWISPVATTGKPRRLVVSDDLVWPMFWTADGSEILALHNHGREWTVDVLETESGQTREVGDLARLASGKDMVYEFKPGSEKYRALVYPAGVIVADGKDSSDLYVIRARESLGTRAASFPTPWLPWRGHIAWAGYF